MPEPKTEYDYGAYCGLYCGACAILLANERGVAEKLLERGGRGLHRRRPDLPRLPDRRRRHLVPRLRDAAVREAARRRVDRA